MLHLGFSIAIFFVEKPDEKVVCGDETFELDMREELTLL